jgi:hypothetical protein
VSIPEQVGKVTTTTVEALRSVPLAIALLVVNIGFLAFAAYVLGQVAENAQERNKSQTELIQSLIKEMRDCVVPPKPSRTRSVVFRERYR